MRPDDKLRTESALAARFGVNRQLRCAMRLKRWTDERWSAARGAGCCDLYPYRLPHWPHASVSPEPHRTRRIPGKEFLTLENPHRTTREKAARCLWARNAQVQVCEGLSFADDQVIALFRSVFSARVSDMLAAS